MRDHPDASLTRLNSVDGCRTSSVSAANWRTQRTAVHSLSQSGALSTLSTVLTVPPPRDALSPFIMRTSALAFHPREMVFAVGSLDGHGAWLILPVPSNIALTICLSACYGLQTPFLSRSPSRECSPRSLSTAVTLLSHITPRYHVPKTDCLLFQCLY